MAKTKKEIFSKSNSTQKIESKDHDIQEIILDYRLHELPSSQHKAGLAGLVLMVRWLKRNKYKLNGILEELECTDKSYKLKLDKDGMKSLFDETYSASWEEQIRDKPLKNKDKEEIPYKRKEKLTLEEIDKKTKKPREKDVYIYDIVVPSGSFLVDWDSSQNGLWLKLWRDMVWSILRGIPLTRIVYEDRANKKNNKDHSEIWDIFTNPKKGSKKSDLQGTYFLGSQDKNSEGISFLDKTKYFLLLHFWPFISQIYVPQKLEYDNKTKTYNSKDEGYVISIPEIIDLNNFSLDYEVFVKARDNTPLGFRPKSSRITILEESGWESFLRLKASLSKLEGKKNYSDLVTGFDIFQFLKEGNNINNKATFRIRPDDTLLKEYEAFKNDQYYDPVFRKQVLTNISNHKIWYTSFDKLFQKSSYEYFMGSGSFFPRDVKSKFYKGFEITQKEKKQMEETLEVEEAKSVSLENAKSLEQIIYSMIWTYISMKLDSKYGLKKENSKTNEYKEKKEKLAKEAFLAIRSRTGEDFISYFSSTICSVGQYMNEERYLTLTTALFDETEKVRTLTMLALSAVSYTYQKKENENGKTN